MNRAGEIILADARTSLAQRVNQDGVANRAIEAFYKWLGVMGDVAPEWTTFTNAAAQDLRATRQYASLAAIGYMIARRAATDEHIGLFRDEVERLFGREPFVGGQPMAFCVDVIALLGIISGVGAINDPAISKRCGAWLDGFVRQCSELDGTEDWQRCFYFAMDAGRSLALPSVDGVADVRLALHSQGALSHYDFAEMDEGKSLMLAKRANAHELDGPRAAMRLRAIDWACRALPAFPVDRVSVEDISKILSRVEAALHHWTYETTPRTRNGVARIWHVDHEYHVQNLLAFLLRPFLPDLKTEENLPSLGQKKPRADLYFPSLKLIIEVKYWYNGDRPQKIIDEVASDASIYLVDKTRYTAIIAFIWDEGARVQEHELLRSGLVAMPGIRDAITVSRPGNWHN